MVKPENGEVCLTLVNDVEWKENQTEEVKLNGCCVIDQEDHVLGDDVLCDVAHEDDEAVKQVIQDQECVELGEFLKSDKIPAIPPPNTGMGCIGGAELPNKDVDLVNGVEE